MCPILLRWEEVFLWFTIAHDPSHMYQVIRER